jgi:Icc-related predicted phosphoesterase
MSETTLFFATDLHGSEKCFKKFVNAASFYRARLLFLGGDLAGKRIVSLWRGLGGSWQIRGEGGKDRKLSDTEAKSFHQRTQDAGDYLTDRSADELTQMSKPEKEALFRRLATDRLFEWLSLAKEKLELTSVRIIAIPGNDDPTDFDTVFAEFPFIEYLDGAATEASPGVWVAGVGGSNITPWATHREMTEEQIGEKLERAMSMVPAEANVIFHVHVPPYKTGIDLGPALDAALKVKMGAGGPLMEPFGSTAVRASIEQWQPVLGLFGHVHEARGVTRIGKSVCVNPGSHFSTGMLSGFWATVEGKRVIHWRLTEG